MELYDYVIMKYQVCLFVCLSLSQTLIDDSGHKENTGQLLNSRVITCKCPVSNNLNYDSSLSLSVSFKVIPKSFGACLNST